MMPLNDAFYEVATTLEDPGMGTEHVAPLLYALARMRRPSRILAVGLGYSTLFLLQALVDSEAERASDASIRANGSSAARLHVLGPSSPSSARPQLIGIDDFSAGGGRLEHFQQCVAKLGLTDQLDLQRCRYQDFQVNAGDPAFELVWVDCGHQLEYADLANRFWPLVDADGGIFAMHYTHVDVPVPGIPVSESVVIPGPWVNAAKQQQLRAGLSAGFELLSLVEPHKIRQGSLTLMRKIDVVDRCRPQSLDQELRAFYGEEGVQLDDLHGSRS